MARYEDRRAVAMSPLHQAALIARLVRDTADGGADDQLLIDAIEGETNALQAVDHLLEDIGEAEANAAVCKLRADELQRREEMWQARAQRHRSVLLRFMEETGVGTLKRSEATLSVRKAKPGVTWEADLNVDALPERFVRVTRTVDKSAVKEAVLAGEIVPGAVRNNGSASLSVRRG